MTYALAERNHVSDAPPPPGESPPEDDADRARYTFRTSPATNVAIRALLTELNENRPADARALSVDQILAAAARIATRDRVRMRQGLEEALSRPRPAVSPYQSFRTRPATNDLIRDLRERSAGEFGPQLILDRNGRTRKTPVSADAVIAAVLFVAAHTSIWTMLDEVYREGWPAGAGRA